MGESLALDPFEVAVREQPPPVLEDVRVLKENLARLRASSRSPQSLAVRVRRKIAADSTSMERHSVVKSFRTTCEYSSSISSQRLGRPSAPKSILSDWSVMSRQRARL